MFGWSSSFMIHISRSSPNGMTLPGVGSCSALLIRFAKLSARTFSAVDFEIIFAAPYCPVPVCRTRRTREQPPRPIVLPNCQGPMLVLRRRTVLETLVLAFEISESRLELWERGSWAWTAERRLFSSEDCCSCRTARLPLGTMDSLWGSGFDDEDGIELLLYLSPRRGTGGFALAREELSARARRRVGGRPW
jgi:hypothetical protein